MSLHRAVTAPRFCICSAGTFTSIRRRVFMRMWVCSSYLIGFSVRLSTVFRISWQDKRKRIASPAQIRSLTPAHANEINACWKSILCKVTDSDARSWLVGTSALASKFLVQLQQLWWSLTAVNVTTLLNSAWQFRERVCWRSGLRAG